MLSTISRRMTAILTSFALLLGAGTAASYFVLKRQADDGLIVNLAGRQRMLTQKMTKESAQLVNAAHEHNDTQVANLRELMQSTMRVFEMTLYALKDGGPAPLNLEMTRVRQTPPASTAEIAKQLEAVVALWEPFKAHLQTVASSNGTDTVTENIVMAANVQLLGQMNKAVDMMQADAEEKVNVLYVIQGAAFAMGLILVTAGIWVTRASITRPLRELATAAHAMSTGKLDVKVEAGGAKEVEELAASFERMRASMLVTLGGGLRPTGTDDDI